MDPLIPTDQPAIVGKRGGRGGGGARIGRVTRMCLTGHVHIGATQRICSPSCVLPLDVANDAVAGGVCVTKAAVAGAPPVLTQAVAPHWRGRSLR